MATTTTGSLLCRQCTESEPMPTENAKNTRFLTFRVSIPEGVDADMIEALVKGLCAQCEPERESEAPPEMLANSDLYTSNRPPLVAEEKILDLQREKAKQELSIVEVVLSTTQQQLKQIEQRKKALEDHVSELNGLLSAVRRIPEEVLSEIGQFTIAGREETKDRRGSMDVTSGIWPLSQVCSSWRRTIVNTPMLWSNIEILDIHPPFSPAILLQCINRSQSVLLDIAFVSDETDTNEIELSKLLLQQICSLSHRWRSLRLSLHPSQWSTLDQIRNTLTELQSLALDSPFDDMWDYGPWECDIFASAPKLQTVRIGLDNYALGSPSVCLQLPTAPIAKFELWIDKYVYAHVADIIPRSAVEVKVFAQANLAPPPSPTIYPLISHLSIRKVPRLLDIFTCPQLDILELCDVYINQGFLDHHLAPFLIRSTQRFSTLCLRHTLSSRTSIRPLFQITSAITELVVTSYVNSRSRWLNSPKLMMQILEWLCLSSDPSNDLLPRLSTLTLKFNDFRPTKSFYTLIHAVVDSRVNPPIGYSGETLRNFSLADERNETTTTTLARYNDLLQLAQDCPLE